jgi:hypothetical protein
MKIIKKSDIMNRRKMTLNEELNQIKRLFGHMNIPMLIKESVVGPGGPGKSALGSLDSGSSIAKYVGVQVSKDIEDAIVLASKNSDAITKSLGKQINSFADLEVAYPGLSRSEVAMSAIKSMEKQTAQNLINNISEQLAPVNLTNLKINLTKLTAPEVQSLKTSLSNLESGSLKQLSDPATADAAAEILPITITKIREEINGISDVSLPLTTKQSLLDTLDGIESQVNTKIISKEVEDLVQVSNNQSLGVSQNLSLNNSVISSNSFVNTLDKIDFTKMSLYNASLTKEQLLDVFNKNVSYGLNLVWKSNDEKGWNYIPKSGFESWGIPDLRDYMKKNITRMIEVDPSTGRWKVEFGSNSGQPIPVVNKSINVTTGSGTSGYKQIEISPDDFKVGALRVGGKVEETMTEEQLVKLVDDIIQKRFNWLDSPEYKRRRMNATLETSEEVDSAILQIKKYMNEDLKFIFKLDPDKYMDNNLGMASQSAWVYADRNGLTPNDSSTLGVGVREIEIQPHKNLETIKGTIDHEVDHIMSATLDGGTTYKAYKNLKSYLGPKLLKLDPKYKEKNPILSLFDTNIGNTTEDWLKYVGNNEESFARLNRLNFWFKEKYGLSDQSELTKGQVDTLWDEYTTKWRRGETPEGYEDIKWLLNGFYETNPWDRKVNKVKMKEDLRTILNASFAIGGLIALNQFGEE